LDILAKPLHKDFRRYTYPQSIGQAVQTKEEWLERFAGLLKFSTDFEVSYSGCHIGRLLTKPLSQSTLHSAIEAPGKIILHVCLLICPCRSHTHSPSRNFRQATNEAKNPYGVNTVRESIFIVHIVTDDDGSLKIKQLDEFTDSKAYLEIAQAFAAVKANK